MKFLNRNASLYQGINMVEDIETMFTSTPVLSDSNFGKIAYSAESMKNSNYDDEVKNAQTIQQSLVATGFDKFLAKQAKLDSCKPGTPEHAHAEGNIERAMEAAVATSIALINPDEYQREYFNASAEAPDGVRVINSTIAGHASSYDYSTEGFDKFNFDKFRASAIVSNALNAMTNSFEDTWFKPVMISPSEQGADVTIRIPYVFNSKKRNVNGDPYEPEHKLVIDAYRDRSILANTGNKVFANVANIDAGYVAAVADVPNRAVTLNSTTFNTRPLLFGHAVDILSGSAHAGLPDSASQDESDTLSPTAMLGKVYAKITYDGEDTVVIIDTSALTGSLFVPSTVGDTQELLLNMNTVMFADSESPTADGVAPTAALPAFLTDISQTATQKFRFALNVKLSGSFWPRRGNIEVNSVSTTPISVAAIYDDAGDEITLSATNLAKLSVGLVAYEPDLTRTNSNLRDKGMAVDLGSTIKYRYAVPMLSPITSSKPVSVEGGGVGMDGLQMVRRARNNNIAVQTLFDYAAIVKACSGQKTQHAGIGSALVTPTYVEDTVDLQSKAVFVRSKGNRDDVRDALGAAIDQVASELLEKSGYLSTLDALYGTTAGYEVIIATSPRIHSLLMTSGDARLLGSNRPFTIVSNHDDDFVDEIYISVRRPGETNVDPLSFGAHVSVPPLIYSAPVTVRAGSHSLDVQLIARDLFVPTCPVLGRLSILNLNSLFTD